MRRPAAAGRMATITAHGQPIPEGNTSPFEGSLGTARAASGQFGERPVVLRAKLIQRRTVVAVSSGMAVPVSERCRRPS